ncbi:MAG: FkbM family methyltransferase [Clostridia bacterium]|nr:FkbM family methyltransferase [Clostridia bacterium]
MEQELWQYLKQTTKPIVLYGMGNGADKIINVLETKGISFQGVFASDGFVRDKLFHGHKISSYAELKQKFGDMIVLLCFGSSLPGVIENILKIAAEQELYAPEVPVIGGGLFDYDFLHKNAETLKWVYDRLADETSRKTFENIIYYKLSGKINYLLDCEVSQDEPYTSFLKLNNDSFLDLGAYNGDTALDFAKRCKNYNSITAVEPDKKTFKKLLLNTEHLENFKPINACISDKCETVNFKMLGGRNSVLGDGKDQINAITVDSLNFAPTYIKMDVEGEEVAAINGAKQTILSHKPKMLISAYHRTDDLITIPKAVLDIRDDYKIYIRHFSYLPAWDTNFYFV